MIGPYIYGDCARLDLASVRGILTWGRVKLRTSWKSWLVLVEKFLSCRILGFARTVLSAANWVESKFAYFCVCAEECAEELLE